MANNEKDPLDDLEMDAQTAPEAEGDDTPNLEDMGAPENQETGEHEAGPPPAEESTPSQPPAEGEWVPRSALEDERRKRQEAEARLEAPAGPPAWAQQIPQRGMEPPQPQAPWGQSPNPEAQQGVPYRTLYDENGAPVQVPDVQALVQQAVQPYEARLEQMSESQRIDASEVAARGRHADFDAAMQGFQYEAALNPGIWQQLRRMENPGEFAYQVGQRRLAFERSMNPSASQQTQTAAPAQPAPAQPKPNLPESLSERAGPGAAPRRATVPDDPLDDVGRHFIR